MICPKCQNVMHTVDRMGIHIDQCDGCRGIFLDRGELEQIVGAEQRHYQPAAPPPYRSDSPAPYRGGHGGYQNAGYRDSPHGYGHGGYKDSPHGYGHGGRRKKRSFLEELFD
ncbi:zf-TFIIB domain-containing protein [Actinophytocola sp.]|uniref:TFIIB-type zinc ribbon-containing protein n=1 Tax=Actinophytocola sp. TaxID=1872138 RepID=UPI002D7FED44|nr:zf-TFIIB domain-containing protein [Actinophytocola sp.]HET9141910.1 zf-TFIIB domain-containing protein [Actinophytocola sp.]